MPRWKGNPEQSFRDGSKRLTGSAPACARARAPRLAPALAPAPAPAPAPALAPALLHRARKPSHLPCRKHLTPCVRCAASSPRVRTVPILAMAWVHACREGARQRHAPAASIPRHERTHPVEGGVQTASSLVNAVAWLHPCRGVQSARRLLRGSMPRHGSSHVQERCIKAAPAGIRSAPAAIHDKARVPKHPAEGHAPPAPAGIDATA